MKSFEFQYRVRLDDLDFMGVVGDERWLTFLQRARIELLEQIGFSYQEMTRRKIGGVVAENHIKYLRPATYGEQLTVQVTPHDPFKLGLSLSYAVRNASGVQCITSQMKLIFIDGESGRPTRMPEEIVTALFPEAGTQ